MAFGDRPLTPVGCGEAAPSLGGVSFEIDHNSSAMRLGGLS